jgi:hypothetical protein
MVAIRTLTMRDAHTGNLPPGALKTAADGVVFSDTSGRIVGYSEKGPRITPHKSKSKSACDLATVEG